MRRALFLCAAVARSLAPATRQYDTHVRVSSRLTRRIPTSAPREPSLTEYMRLPTAQYALLDLPMGANLERAPPPPGAAAAFEFYTSLNAKLLVVARDAAVELLRAGAGRASRLAPSLYASVHLAAYKESCAVERGLVAATLLEAESSGEAVPLDALLRLKDAAARQDAERAVFLSFAPKRALAAYAKHAALDCVQGAARLRSELLGPLDDVASRDAPSHRLHACLGARPSRAAPRVSAERWFSHSSCRVDSLQALQQDLDDLVQDDATRIRAASAGRGAVLAAGALGGLAALAAAPGFGR
mmetsp:Transcript_18640/g.56688  ORF Transcript_18640/g.56688 Transcript_18640/m.56688 type:complete len:301 (+) Transcript_18640:396-1298(+)